MRPLTLCMVVMVDDDDDDDDVATLIERSLQDHIGAPCGNVWAVWAVLPSDDHG